MAVPGRKRLGQLMDECEQVFCLYCEQFGIRSQASEYCTDCYKDVCTVCSQCHHAPLYHDTDNMFDSVSSGSALDRKKYLAIKPCTFDDNNYSEKHATNKMEYECSSCNENKWFECMAMDHKTCSNYRKNTSHRHKYTRDVTKLHRNVNTLNEDSKLFNKQLLEDIKCVNETYSVVLKQILAYREKMIEHLDQLFTNTVKEAQKIKKQNCKDLNDLIDDNEALREEMEKIRVHLGEISSKEAVFNHVKKSEKWLNFVELKLKQLQEGRESLTLDRRFVESSDVEYLLSEHKTLGRFETTGRSYLHESVLTGSATGACASSSSTQENNEQYDSVHNEDTEKLFAEHFDDSLSSFEDKIQSSQKSEYFDNQGSNDFEFSDKNISYTGSINLKTADDSYVCGINDCLILESGRLVVTDGLNNCVKLVDLDMSTVQSVCNLIDSPDCVTSLTEYEVAVTLPMAHSIQFLDVGNIVTVSHTVKVQGECRGIAYKDGKLAVTFKKPNRVMIMTPDGTMIQTVLSPDVNAHLNITPSAIIFGTEMDTLIMSDIFHHVVVKVNFRGKVLASYDSDTLRLPLGLTMTEEGNILVCCSKSACVHSINNDLNTGKVILQNESSVVKPSCVAFCGITNNLYICNFGPRCSDTVNNSIQVFQLL